LLFIMVPLHNTLISHSIAIYLIRQSACPPGGHQGRFWVSVAFIKGVFEWLSCSSGLCLGEFCVHQGRFWVSLASGAFIKSVLGEFG